MLAVPAFVEIIVAMPGTNIENQLLLTNAELNRRIALLEETFVEKAKTGNVLQDNQYIRYDDLPPTNLPSKYPSTC